MEKKKRKGIKKKNSHIAKNCATSSSHTKIEKSTIGRGGTPKIPTVSSVEKSE